MNDFKNSCIKSQTHKNQFLRAITEQKRFELPCYVSKNFKSRIWLEKIRKILTSGIEFNNDIFCNYDEFARWKIDDNEIKPNFGTL